MGDDVRIPSSQGKAMVLLQRNVRYRGLALGISDGLRSRFPEVWPHGPSRQFVRSPRAVHAPRMLDVNYTTPELGIGFCVSLKRGTSVRGAQPHTFRMSKIDEELRNEASGYHQRQPFAVMIAVVFLPADAYDDASDRHSSSFGAWVKYLRPLSGRRDPGDDIARFEKVFVGTYDSSGTTLEFFDVENAPPRRGRPKAVLTYFEFLDEVEKSYLERNAAEFHWADSQDTDEDDPERSS